MKEEEQHLASVFQIILEILMLHVDQNVWFTLIAPQVKHVNNYIVLIPAQELVGLMQIVGYKTISQLAHALRGT